MQTIDHIIDTVQDLKIKAKNRRDLNRYDAAFKYLDEAIKQMEKFSNINSPLPEKDERKLNSQYADCYGIRGGIYRRKALSENNASEQKSNFEKSLESYTIGLGYEKNGFSLNSYNLVNSLVSVIFTRPELMDPGYDHDNGRIKLLKNLNEAEQIVQEQLKTPERKGDIWALADEGLLRILLSKEAPDTVFATFVGKSRDIFAYDSLLSTLIPLSALRTPLKNDLKIAIDYLRKEMANIQSSLSG